MAAPARPRQHDRGVDRLRRAAILITGGTVDLGTAAEPGGNTFDVNGTGELVHNTTASNVPDIGNLLEVDGAALSPSNLRPPDLGEFALLPDWQNQRPPRLSTGAEDSCLDK